MVKYRAAAVDGLEYFDELAEMHKACFPIEEMPPFDHGEWWIVYDKNKDPAAFAGIKPSYQWLDTGYLCRAGVLSHHRGQGLQRRLIRKRIRRARELGWKWLVTDTNENTISANNLIECGFRMYTPSSPWSFKTACYWRLKIA